MTKLNLRFLCLVMTICRGGVPHLRLHSMHVTCPARSNGDEHTREDGARQRALLETHVSTLSSFHGLPRDV
jgi:hypothetical protein